MYQASLHLLHVEAGLVQLLLQVFDFYLLLTHLFFPVAQRAFDVPAYLLEPLVRLCLRLVLLFAVAEVQQSFLKLFLDLSSIQTELEILFL